MRVEEDWDGKGETSLITMSVSTSFTVTPILRRVPLPCVCTTMALSAYVTYAVAPADHNQEYFYRRSVCRTFSLGFLELHTLCGKKQVHRTLTWVLGTSKLTEWSYKSACEICQTMRSIPRKKKHNVALPKHQGREKKCTEIIICSLIHLFIHLYDFCVPGTMPGAPNKEQLYRHGICIPG